MREEVLPTPADGQFLYELLYLSLDPTNRIWMSDMDQYMEPVALGDTMRGVICGRVLESRKQGINPGDIVSGLGGWADYQISDGTTVAKFDGFGDITLVDAFGMFAVVGPTAYFGLIDIGKPKPGETVVVSAAAGAVGSIVGQIGKIVGCRVVGLAGTDAKCAWITKVLSFDAAINYKTAKLPAALRAACPNGIDVYFDNTGGPILDAVLGQVNLHARIPTCGLISMYNSSGPVPGPPNYPNILMKRVRVEGFIVLDYASRRGEAVGALKGWMKDGRLKHRLDLVDGFEQAAKAVRRLFTGENNGKLLIRVRPE
jgi:NADPH-dependent curcumin reductase CurA